jgi:hypothetical protein
MTLMVKNIKVIFIDGCCILYFIAVIELISPLDYVF